jgi:hypothetical protein
MPNVNKATGLSPVKYLGGADWDGKGNMYYIAPADVNAFYIGDLVDLNNVADPTRGIQGITLATAGNPAVGVIVGIGTNPEGGPYINPDNLNSIWRPAGAQPQAYYALVCDTPDVIFEAQENGAAGATITAAQASKNANIIYAAPAAGVRVSGTMIASGSVAVTATLNLKLLGLVRKYEGNGSLNTYGQYAKWLCVINNHRYKTGVASP